jgi:hypothetical protein
MPRKFDLFVGMGDELTEIQMKDFLNQRKVSFPAQATYEEIVQLYHVYRGDDESLFSNAINDVQFPLLPARALHQSVLFAPDSNIKLKAGSENKQSTLEGIVRDMATTPDDIENLLFLLASLTKFEAKMQSERTSFKHVVPANIIQMSDDCRVHTGRRIIARALRHAVDPGTASIANASFLLGYLNDDEPCLIVRDHSVKASMKSESYKVECAFGHQKFIAAVCQCKAGCRNDSSQKLGSERIVCTHSFVPMVQLSQLLLMHLAEDVLLELRIRLMIDESEFRTSLSADRTERFRLSIEQLMTAAKKESKHLDPQQTFSQWLADFSVGTDASKQARGEPRAQDLGFFREKCKFQSPEKIAYSNVTAKIEIFEKGQQDGEKGSESLPNWLAMKQCMDAVILLENSKSAESASFTPIGFELLDHRVQKQIPLHERSGVQYNSAVQHIKANLDLALSSAEKATRGLNRKSHSSSHQVMAKGSRPLNNISNTTTNNVVSPATKRARVCCASWCVKQSDSRKCVPSLPDRPASMTLQRHKTWQKKKFIRSEYTERLGLGRNVGSDVDLRFCSNHKMEMVTGKRTSIKTGSGDTQQVHSFSIPPFEAPLSTCGDKGFQSPPIKAGKGIGTDRQMHRHVRSIQSISPIGLVLQQTQEMEEVDRGMQSLKDINSRVLEAAGLTPHLDPAIKKRKRKDDSGDDNQHSDASAREPKIKPSDLTSAEVKRRTGFRDLNALLSFALVTCNGNMSELLQVSSKLTWLEEWLFGYEFMYGRTACRWQDFEKSYGCTVKPLRAILKQKVKLVLAARKRWPMYASYEEDADLRAKQWNEHFDKKDGMRIIMHDATNVPFPTPQNAHLQRAMWSDYYGQCCAKGGISNQLSGWIRTIPLMTGRITDSSLITTSMILKQQKEFAKEDTSSVKPVTNVFDKGFRNALDAAMEGQSCCQPKYSKGQTQQFSGQEVLHSAGVAVLRSGNERAVQRVKVLWFLKRGCAYHLWDVDLVCDIWEAWGYQVNFMYDKFL